MPNPTASGQRRSRLYHSAEILPQFFHKKGMLAAARQPDQMNPEKRSSGSQFYIVQGKIFRPSELDSLESKLNINRENAMMQAMMGKAQTELNQLRAEGKQEEFMARIAEIREAALNETAKLAPFKFTPEQKEAYTTIGGYPSLDGNYTIFGEVVEGLDVLDKIAAQQTGQFDRPVNDIHFNVKVLEK
jgi:cyclophilin family peptidyl-prolyl cis-trans isomerase